jgi:ribosomal protein S1
LRAFLDGIRRGETLTGTVTGVHNFGVFVSLDSEPADTWLGRTGHTGNTSTRFIQVTELTWSRINHASDVVEIGQRVAGEVIDVDMRRGQVSVSLKALQEDPFIRLADHVGEIASGHVGEIASGHVTKLVPFGVFVRVAHGIEGLLPLSELSDEPVERLTRRDCSGGGNDHGADRRGRPPAAPSQAGRSPRAATRQHERSHARVREASASSCLRRGRRVTRTTQRT